MEFSYDINYLIKDDITRLDSKLVPYRNTPGNNGEYKKQLHEIIDKMGVASAKAQGLHGAITSASRLMTSNHSLYVLKDVEANGGMGAVVGILKMGRKKLFVYDSHGIQHEMDPYCVLDFYVHESRQRMGCGKKLFEHMLQNDSVKPCHLAIDRPSHKFQSFLRRHYNLKATIPQVNNFVVFEGFFGQKSNNKSKRGGYSQNEIISPYSNRPTVPNGSGRVENRLPPATLYNQSSSLPSIPQAQAQREALSNVSPHDQENSLNSANSATRETNNLNLTLSAMGAKQNNYSRHGGMSEVPNIRRDGPSKEYTQLNSHDYLGSRGHLKVAPAATQLQNNTNGIAQHNTTGIAQHNTNGMTEKHKDSDRVMPQNFTPYTNSRNWPHSDPHKTQSVNTRQDTTWNVLGVPSQQQKYQLNNRLW